MVKDNPLLEGRKIGKVVHSVNWPVYGYKADVYETDNPHYFVLDEQAPRWGNTILLGGTLQDAISYVDKRKSYMLPVAEYM